MMPLSNDLSDAVTVCGTASWLTQLMVPPTAIVIVCGENWLPTMSTEPVVGSAAVLPEVVVLAVVPSPAAEVVVSGVVGVVGVVAAVGAGGCVVAGAVAAGRDHHHSGGHLRVQLAEVVERAHAVEGLGEPLTSTQNAAVEQPIGCRRRVGNSVQVGPRHRAAGGDGDGLW